MANLDTDKLFKDVAPEVRRYFENKGLRPSDGWRDFAPAEHAYAFTVARTAGYDVLKDIRDAVDAAIAKRQSFEDFRAALEPVLKAKGWWGKTTDPATGEIIQLGSPRRLKTIFWANTRTAYAAGEWEKIERAKRVLPYLVYVESTAKEKRAEHLAWVGTILPVDDPWWEEHYPPNGWGCMCRVRQISEREALSLGYEPQSPERPADFGRQSDVNMRTGEIVETPVGVDPGWNSNPGRVRSRAVVDLAAGRLDAMPEDQRRAAAADYAGSWLARRILDGGFGFDPANATPAMQARGAIAAPVAALPEGMASTRTLRLTVADAADLGASSLDGLQQLVDAGLYRRDGSRIVIEGEVSGRALRAVIEDDGRAARLVRFGPADGDL